MERPISFFAMLFILLFVIIGFIFVVFDLKGVAFAFELALLLAFMFFLAFGIFLAYSNKSASWSIIAAVLVLLLFDVSIIFFITQSFGWEYVMTTLFAVAGLVVCLVNILAASRREPKAVSHYDKQQYYYPLRGKAESEEELKVEKENKQEQKVVAAYTPGKFVASKNASKFHIAKCVWANNIKKENHVWFNSKAEAIAKGFSEHKCDVVNVRL